MAQRAQPINLTDFTGGLNFRGDAFGLADGESPEMLNVDVDPRGGFVARKGWSRWNSASIATPWDPRTLFVHELSDGTDRVWLANNSRVSHSTSGAFTVLQAAGTDVVADAVLHGADFAPWGDSLYIACGQTLQSVEVVGTTGTRMTAAGAASWTAYASPSSNVMPSCDYMVSHMGYVFAASTYEDAAAFPHRVRWSHPNNPKAWLQADFIDLKEGGGPITALVPMTDHLLVFKQSAVWAIYGYDSDTWQVVNVSRTTGAVNRSSVAAAEGMAFFYSQGEGVYMIRDGQRPEEISLPLRPMFDNGHFSLTATDGVWLGWVGQRLYWGAPYAKNTTPTDASVVFVFDPAIGQRGAWMMHQGADGMGLGPFAQGGFGGGAGLKFGCSRTTADIMIVEAADLPEDDFGGTPTGFESYYVTKWVDGGWPTLKKAWRRPDLVVKEREQAYNVTIQSYKDYDEANVSRTKVVPIAAGTTGAVWGSFTWGDGTLYGPPAQGSTIERGGSFGAARSLQLRITGETSKPWGVDAIVLKFIPRRFR